MSIVLLWQKTFIKAASGSVIDSIGEFNSQNLANAVWAFAKLSKTAERRAAQQAPPKREPAGIHQGFREQPGANQELRT